MYEKRSYMSSKNDPKIWASWEAYWVKTASLGCGGPQTGLPFFFILGSDQGNYLILEDNNEKNMLIFALEPQFHCRKYGFKGK